MPRGSPSVSNFYGKERASRMHLQEPAEEDEKS